MLYVANLGKWLIVSAVLLFILSIVPSLWMLTKKTKHDEKSCEYVARTMQGYGITLILIGVFLLILPHIIIVLIEIALLIIKLILILFTLPFKMIF